MISKDSSVIEDSFQRQKGSGRIDIDLRLHAVGKIPPISSRAPANCREAWYDQTGGDFRLGMTKL